MYNWNARELLPFSMFFLCWILIFISKYLDKTFGLLLNFHCIIISWDNDVDTVQREIDWNTGKNSTTTINFTDYSKVWLSIYFTKRKVHFKNSHCIKVHILQWKIGNLQGILLIVQSQPKALETPGWVWHLLTVPEMWLPRAYYHTLLHWLVITQTVTETIICKYPCQKPSKANHTYTCMWERFAVFCFLLKYVDI